LAKKKDYAFGIAKNWKRICPKLPEKKTFAKKALNRKKGDYRDSMRSSS